MKKILEKQSPLNPEESKQEDLDLLISIVKFLTFPGVYYKILNKSKSCSCGKKQAIKEPMSKGKKDREGLIRNLIELGNNEYFKLILPSEFSFEEFFDFEPDCVYFTENPEINLVICETSSETKPIYHISDQIVSDNELKMQGANMYQKFKEQVEIYRNQSTPFEEFDTWFMQKLQELSRLLPDSSSVNDNNFLSDSFSDTTQTIQFPNLPENSFEFTSSSIEKDTAFDQVHENLGDNEIQIEKEKVVDLYFSLPSSSFLNGFVDSQEYYDQNVSDINGENQQQFQKEVGYLCIKDTENIKFEIPKQIQCSYESQQIFDILGLDL